MGTSLYLFLAKLLLILALPISILPFIIILSTFAASCSAHEDISFLEIVSSAFRYEVARIGSGLALLWVVIQFSHFILDKIQLYLENFSQSVFFTKVAACFVLYIIVTILQFLARTFHFPKNKGMVILVH